jgi:hypothetical protein
LRTAAVISGPQSIHQQALLVTSLYNLTQQSAQLLKQVSLGSRADVQTKHAQMLFNMDRPVQRPAQCRKALDTDDFFHHQLGQTTALH